MPLLSILSTLSMLSVPNGERRHLRNGGPLSEQEDLARLFSVLFGMLWKAPRGAGVVKAALSGAQGVH